MDGFKRPSLPGEPLAKAEKSPKNEGKAHREEEAAEELEVNKPNNSKTKNDFKRPSLPGEPLAKAEKPPKNEGKTHREEEAAEELEVNKPSNWKTKNDFKRTSLPVAGDHPAKAEKPSKDECKIRREEEAAEELEVNKPNNWKTKNDFKRPSLPGEPPAKAEKPSKDECKTRREEEAAEELEVNKPTPAPKTPSQNCPYKIPSWSKTPTDNIKYSFEVLKSGQIISQVEHLETKAFWSFGRLPENNIEMAHPTISRFHAILQFRPKDSHAESVEDCAKEDTQLDKGPPEGWYIYDLDSTHGTFLNKQRIPPKVFIRIRVGHMLRLGASSRSYILQGPTEDEEPESELTVSELKAKRQQDLEAAQLEKKRLTEEAAERERNEGCGWGMGDDADEETDLAHNPYASSNNEDLFFDDPKKTLRGYFEREGLTLEYKCDEMSAGSFVCRVELPLDNDNGRPIIAEVVHKGKKKDCVVQCALEACRILDRHGVLRVANQEPLKRKQKSNNSDSEDEFLDRTGDVARKKQRKAKESTIVTLTYEDLLRQETELNEELKTIETNISTYQEQQKHLKIQKEQNDQGEDLDRYMQNLQTKEAPMDKTEIKKLRLEEQRIKSELQRNQRLLKIAKPANMPFIRNPLDMNPQQTSDPKKRQLPMVGKRNQFSKFKIIKPSSTDTAVLASHQKSNTSLDSEEEVEETVEVRTETKNKTRIQDVFETNEETDPAKGDQAFECIDKLKDIVTTSENVTENTTRGTSKDTTEQSDAEAVEATTSAEREHSFNLNKTPETDLEKSIEETALENAKKRRSRIRQRGKRQEVDMEDDDEYESADKYAKWVPPENQSGDGFTELNKKFGY